jgi:hypothetical protein
VDHSVECHVNRLSNVGLAGGRGKGEVDQGDDPSVVGILAVRAHLAQAGGVEVTQVVHEFVVRDVGEEYISVTSLAVH